MKRPNAAMPMMEIDPPLLFGPGDGENIFVRCPVCQDGNAHIVRLDVESGGGSAGSIDYVFDERGEGHPRAEPTTYTGRGVRLVVTFRFETCLHVAKLSLQFHKGATFARTTVGGSNEPPVDDQHITDIWRD